MMSAGRAKRRGRPPKNQGPDKPRKFQYHLLKKPKYLLNQSGKEFDIPSSRTSTPIASRASSPHGSDGSRRSITRSGLRGRVRGKSKGGGNTRRSYASEIDDKNSDYHYGSDFGDDVSDKSDTDRSDSDMESSQLEIEKESDSDYSISSYSTAGTYRRKAVSPEPIWLQDREIPPLTLPKSSDDLMIPKEYVMQALSIYEVLRHFRTLARLSPFRFEDFCAALMHADQSYLLAEIHIMLLKAVLREEEAQQTHFGPLDQKDSVNACLYFIDAMTWPEILRSYIESDKSFNDGLLQVMHSAEYPFTDVENVLKVLQFLTDEFLVTNPVREDLIHEGKGSQNFQFLDYT